MVSGLTGATPCRGTRAFDIHAAALAGCGLLPGGTNRMCRHHRTLIHRLRGECRVLSNLQSNREKLSLMTFVVPLERY